MSSKLHLVPKSTNVIQIPSAIPEPEVFASPQEEILEEAYENIDRTINIAIIAQFDDGSLKIFQSLEPAVDLTTFLEVAKTHIVQAASAYLSTPVNNGPGPIRA